MANARWPRRRLASGRFIRSLLAAAVLITVAIPGIADPVAALPTPGLLPVPNPLPGGNPGDLIASAPFGTGDFGFAVQGHQVLYHSTDRDGHDLAVSGIVLVPVGIAAPAEGRSVVAWAHGTTGLADGCAPSLDNQYGGRLSSPFSYDRIDRLLAAGHIVTATDYPGLGTPGVHPYLDGVGEGRAVLDSIRVAAAFGATDVAVIQGFSQGSQAAIFAGAEWSTYAPDIDLRAVVPIGTPSRFGEAFVALDMPIVQAYIGKLLAGIVAGHPTLDRAEILTPSGEAAYTAFEAVADDAEEGCIDPRFDLRADLSADPMTQPTWRAAFDANLPGKRPVPVPVLMIQSEADEQALAFLADGVCADLVANGTDVRMWRYDDESHVTTVSVSADDRMRWIDDRLAGRPLTDDVAFTGEAPAVMTTCPGAETPPVDPPDVDDLSGSPADDPDVLPVAVTPTSVRPAFTG